MEIERLFRQYSIPVCTDRKATREGWVQIDCPLCSPGSQKWYLGWHRTKNYASCWKCGYVNSYNLFRELEIPFKELGDLKRQDWKPKERKGKLELPKGLGPLLPAHIKYLKGRKFDPDEIEALWKIQGFSITSPYKWRIYIPIIENGQTQSWTTRAIGNVEPRYKAAPRDSEAYPKSKLLYGEDYARHAVSVHEGATDVWRVGPGAVSTLTVSYTREQVLRLSKYAVRVICFDSEAGAQRRALRLAKELEAFAGETYVVKVSGKDVDTSPISEVKEIRRMIA